MFKKPWQARYVDTSCTSTGSNSSQRSECSQSNLEGTSVRSVSQYDTIPDLQELSQERVSSVLHRLESIQQLAGDAKVLRRKETREHNSRRMKIAQFFNLLLEEAEFNPQSVRQRNVVRFFDGIKQQHAEVYFYSVEEARMKLAYGPSVKLRDALARPHRYADRLMVDMEVLDSMLTELSTQQISDILNKGGDYLTYVQTTYQVKPVEEKDNFLIKNASGLAVYRQSVLVADSVSHCIWRISLSNFTAQGNHEVELYAGMHRQPGLQDGPCKSAKFRSPVGIAVSDKIGKVFVADSDNHSIREVDLKQEIVSTIRIVLSPATTEILGACFFQPKRLCLIHGDGSVYQEMEACQEKKAEEYKEYVATLLLMAEEDDSTTSSSGFSSESLSPHGSELSGTPGSSSSSCSSSSSSSNGRKHEAISKAKAYRRSVFSQYQSLEQSLSQQWMRNYTVLHEVFRKSPIRLLQREMRPVTPKGNPSGAWRLRASPRRSSPSPSSPAVQDKNEASLQEVRLAVSCDHCVWYVDPHTGGAHVVAGHPSQYGYCDQNLGLAARFSSPKGLINIGSVLFIADYWNNVVRTINLYTTKVDTVVDFNPQGPVAIGLSDSGTIYVMDSDCIHYSNILRIMSVPCDGDGNTVGSRTVHEDRFWYQSCFSQPRTRSSSLTSSSLESTSITKASEVWDAYKNKTLLWTAPSAGHSSVPSGRITPRALASPAPADFGGQSVYPSTDLQSRLEEHLRQSAAEEEEEEEDARFAGEGKKRKKARKKRKKKKKKSSRKRNSDDDPMFIDPRLLQGAPSIRISTTLPNDSNNNTVQDREDLKVLQEHGEDKPQSQDGDVNVEQQDGQEPDPLAEALKEQLQQLEVEDIAKDDMQPKEVVGQNARGSLLDGPGRRKSSLLLPDDARMRKYSLHSLGSKQSSKSPLRPRSPGIIDTDDAVERTKIQLHAMGKVSSRRGSFQDTPMTLSDLGITDRRGSMSLSGRMSNEKHLERRGSNSLGFTPATSLKAPVNESSSDKSAATAGFAYQRHHWNNGEYRMMHWDPQEKGAEATAVDPEAGTVMVTGGKAFYRTERAWSEHKGMSVSQNPSRNTSRRPSINAEEVRNPDITVMCGEDEAGQMVNFVTDLAELMSSRRPSRRDSDVSCLDFNDSSILDITKLQDAMSGPGSQHSSRRSSNASPERETDPKQRVESPSKTASESYGKARSSGSLLVPNELLCSSSRRNSTAACSATEISRRDSLQITIPADNRGGIGGSRSQRASAASNSRRNSIASTGNSSEATQGARRGSQLGMLGDGDEVRPKSSRARLSLEIPMGHRNSLIGGNSRKNSLIGLQDGPRSVIEDQRSSLLGSRRGSLPRGSLTLDPEGSAMVHRRSVIDRRGSVGLNIMPTVLDHEDEKMEDGESNESEDKEDPKSVTNNMCSVSNKPGQIAETAQRSSSQSPTNTQSPRNLPSSPESRSPTHGRKGADIEIASPDLKRDSARGEKDETTSLGSDVETRLATTDPSPFTVCISSPVSRAATAEPPRDEMSPVAGSRSVNGQDVGNSINVMSLAKVPFTRDLDVDSLEESMLKRSTDKLPTVNTIDLNSAQSPESVLNRRISTITSSAIGATYKISAAPVSKVWRPVNLPEPLSSSHRTKSKYPNTPLALLWYESNQENFLFVGLFNFPTLIKIIPPKHHEPDKGGRFNVLPIDSQRVLLADESSHQIWLFNHHQHVLKHLAGCGKRGHVDGPLETCRMCSPCALTLDPRSHYIYVADRGNHVIRKIDLMSGLMSTVVGNGFRGNTDGSDRMRQCLDSPFDVSFSEPHFLIISCADNAVRRFNLKTHNLNTILVGS